MANEPSIPVVEQKRPYYLGTSHYSVDDKGRVTVPAEWRREDFESQMVILPARQCVRVYPGSWFAEQMKEITELAPTDEKAIRFRTIAAIGKQATWDGQGRVVLNEELRKKADIKKEAVLRGQGDYFEIWDARRFEQVAGTEATVEDIGL